MMSWTPTSNSNIKAIVQSASDLNDGVDRKAFVELTDFNSLRLLMMKAENPLIITFASEDKAPAEVEIIIYDDSIEEDY